MSTPSLFFPPIINDYINQLEILKRDGKQHSKESDDLYNKCKYANGSLNVSLISSADYSNSWLLYFIGCHYFCSKNFDEKKAEEWFTKSADLENTMAMESLMVLNMYFSKNYKIGIDWFIKGIKFGRKPNEDLLLQINIPKDMFDYTFELAQKYDDEQRETDKEIKNILISKLPILYVSNKYQEIINNLKSVKTQGIDKVLINSILKHL